MKILDVGEPFECTVLTYDVYVILDKVLPCLLNSSEYSFVVRNFGTVGFDHSEVSAIGIIEVVGNMVRLRSWKSFRIFQGQLIETTSFTL